MEEENKDLIETEVKEEPIESTETTTEIENENTTIFEENEIPTANNENDNKEEKPKKSKKGLIFVIILLVALIIGGCVYYVLQNNKTTESKSAEKKKYSSEYRMSGNSLENFDLYFLKLENGKENKIYSPLSIKYALAMLNEGAEGDSKAQIEAVIGDYKGKKYVNSENMSLANAIFIRETFKDSVKTEYTNLLQNKYGAELIFDPFESPANINAWVKDKTLNLLDNLVDNVDGMDIVLVNALAIDMEWVNLIQPAGAKKSWGVSYPHERYSTHVPSISGSGYTNLTFDETQEAKSVIIGASINNYDIVKELGEDSIRETVGAKYQEFIDKGECKVEDDVETYLDKYINEINKGYGQYSSSTDFMIYVDDSVKAFAKDLKEYNGTTLQYVGIMPTNESLYDYVESMDAKEINDIISSLKELKPENFKEGVITKIVGTIPLFKFESSLNLLEDLKKLGINDVFYSEKANLSGISSNKLYIASAVHKANIEFSNEGIKASAATALGGWGAGGDCYFEYLYDVPVEEIDLTFDKPYMYIIRDKETGEVWFTGTVYEPIKYERPNGGFVG